MRGWFARGRGFTRTLPEEGSGTARAIPGAERPGRFHATTYTPPALVSIP